MSVNTALTVRKGQKVIIFGSVVGYQFARSHSGKRTIKTTVTDIEYFDRDFVSPLSGKVLFTDHLAKGKCVWNDRVVSVECSCADLLDLDCGWWEAKELLGWASDKA